MARTRIDLQIETTSPLVRKLIGSGIGESNWSGEDPDRIVKVTYTEYEANIQEIYPDTYYSIPTITTAKQGDTLLSDTGRFFVYDEPGSRWVLWYSFDTSSAVISNNTLTGSGTPGDPLSVNTLIVALKGDLNPLLEGVDNGDNTYTFTSKDGSNSFTIDLTFSTGGVQSVTGDGVDNTDPNNPILSFPDADEVDDSSTTNKFVTQTLINLLNSAIQPGDLATVATTGDYDDLVNTPTLGTAAAADVGDFATAAQGNLADSALQSGDNISELTNDSGYVNSTQAASAAPVQSVNGGTGTVTLDSTDVGAIPMTQKGSNGGVAELDANGYVPSSQLPSFVDDVIEVADFASLPGTGESGKIYITIDDNLTYRWGGSAYVLISSSLALGETSSTAYRGDRGKIAYDHSQLTTGNPHNVTATEAGVDKTFVDGLGVDADTVDGNHASDFATASQGTKADTAVQPSGIADFETTTQLNARDTANRNRANHTGTQTLSTISDSGTAASKDTGVAVGDVVELENVGGSPGLPAVDGSQLIGLPSGVSDHGSLTGLTDDDHTQYLTEARHDALPQDNPHGVTKSQVGLGDVDNTSDADKPVSTAQQVALNSKEDAFSKNTAFNKDFGTTAGTVSEGNHTHSAAYITDFDTEVSNNSDVAANTAKVTNATHTGDVIGDQALTIAANAVDNTKLADVPGQTLKGKSTVGSGNPQDLTPTQVRTLINVEDGATADQTAAEIKSAYESNADTNAFTDAEKTIVGNTSGINTGDQDLSGYQLKPSEGAFQNGDKTKLDSIETGADVTDTANVTLAGALMDSEVDVDIKTLSLPANTTISTFGASLVDDVDASAARSTLGVDPAGTDNSTDVTLGGSPNYLTIAGQVITRSLINLANHVTGILPVANGGTGESSLTGILKGNGTSAFTAVTAPSGAIVGTTDTQTLTNKTLINPAYGSQTLTDAASISWNMNSGELAEVTLGGNRILANPTNLKKGTYVLIVKQDATGSRTLAYGSNFKWQGGTAPTLSTGANDIDILTFVSDGTNLFGVETLDYS